MTRRALRTARHLLLALALATCGKAMAAEISDNQGLATLVYDDSLWTGEPGQASAPGLACRNQRCGGESAACGLSFIDRPDGLPADDAFLEGFRDQLDEETLASARTTLPEGAEVAILKDAEIDTFGDKRGIAVSLSAPVNDIAGRIDYFWFAAGNQLIGLNCVAPAADYEHAGPAFRTIADNMRLAHP